MIRPIAGAAVAHGDGDDFRHGRVNSKYCSKPMPPPGVSCGGKREAFVEDRADVLDGDLRRGGCRAGRRRPANAAAKSNLFMAGPLLGTEPLS